MWCPTWKECNTQINSSMWTLWWHSLQTIAGRSQGSAGGPTMLLFLDVMKPAKFDYVRVPGRCRGGRRFARRARWWRRCAMRTVPAASAAGGRPTLPDGPFGVSSRGQLFIHITKNSSSGVSGARDENPIPIYCTYITLQSKLSHYLVNLVTI